MNTQIKTAIRQALMIYCPNLLPCTQIPQTLSCGAPGEPGRPAAKPAMAVLAIEPEPVWEAPPAQGATLINDNATLTPALVSSAVTFQMHHETK